MRRDGSWAAHPRFGAGQHNPDLSVNFTEASHVSIPQSCDLEGSFSFRGKEGG